MRNARTVDLRIIEKRLHYDLQQQFNVEYLMIILHDLTLDVYTNKR